MIPDEPEKLKEFYVFLLKGLSTLVILLIGIFMIMSLVAGITYMFMYLGIA